MVSIFNSSFLWRKCKKIYNLIVYNLKIVNIFVEKSVGVEEIIIVCDRIYT